MIWKGFEMQYRNRFNEWVDMDYPDTEYKLKTNKMDIKIYQEKAARTMNILENQLTDSIHMILGLQTESAELSDIFKKHIAYGKELDLVNAKEELGDLAWYMANLCNIYGWDLREILETNIKKLEARYKDKFTSDEAINRNLQTERSILENK